MISSNKYSQIICKKKVFKGNIAINIIQKIDSEIYVVTKVLPNV